MPLSALLFCNIFFQNGVQNMHVPFSYCNQLIDPILLPNDQDKLQGDLFRRILAVILYSTSFKHFTAT